MDEQLGRLHASACFNSASTFNEPTLRTKAYANAALTELVKLQLEQPEILSTLLKGGNQGAKLLNTDPYQGLREVIQNADDLGATSVQFGVRTLQGHRQLVIVHNGAPVELPHVLPMIYPFYSTKQKSAELKGRFGIGLKTLTQLGEHLTVHCSPFHFGSRDDQVAMVEEEAPIEGLYDPVADQTMVTVELYPEYDLQSLTVWFDDWAPSDLVFLDHVRSITLLDLDERNTLKHLSIQLTKPTRQFSLWLGKHLSHVAQSTFLVGDALWERFVCEVKVPVGKTRAAKATGGYTPIGVAIPVNGDARGRLHVALPTKIHTNAAFSLDAQFDPSTSREDMIQGPWNSWLTEASGQFIGALAIHLAQQRNTLAWFAVPVSAKTDSSSEWLNKQFSEQWGKAIEAFKAYPTLIDDRYALSQISYCDASIDGMLTEADHLEICGSAMLPEWMRDTNERWREVLNALSVSHVLQLQDVFRHCNQAGFKHKPPEWFLNMAVCCLETDDEYLLLGSNWIPLANGQRTEAVWDGEADCWLTGQPPEIDLALRHQLTHIVHPLMLSPPYVTVVDWLSENANFKAELSAQHALEAFARRYADLPLAAERQDLLDLRDLFEHVDTKATDLGSMVGAALLIDASTYVMHEDGRPIPRKVLASPTKVYLPASIADSQDTWSKAAAYTPDLLWASASYAELFKVSRKEQRSNKAELESTSRKRGVKRFLTLLGAETTPRFLHVSSDSPNSLLPSQFAARRYLGRARGGLRRDLISPDIDAVVQNIRQSPALPTTRKGRKSGSASTAAPTPVERAVALFRCIDANWASIEPYSRTFAYRESGKTDSTPIPTTWLAKLIDFAWFPNAAGTPCKPSGLIVETKVTLAMYEDHTNFASGLTEADANSEFARALGMLVNPPVSQLVAALERERQAASTDDASLMRLYKALAGHCPQSASSVTLDTMIGDMPVSSLRGKFGLARASKGLIAPCITTTKDRKEWYSPRAVFAGKDIFHARQPFVLHDRSLIPLWNALGIRSPDLNSCIRELESLAKTEYLPELDALLIDIYRHMDRLLDKATASDRRSLNALPLRSSEAWSTKRPMYYSSYPSVKSNKVALWEPPCATDSIPRLVEAAGLERLPFASLPSSSASSITDEVRFRFQTALRILKADLARDDEFSYKAMEPWNRLEQANLHLHPPGQLIVNATPKGLRQVPLQLNAHSDSASIAVHFDDPKFIGRIEFGGTAIAGLGNGTRVRDIALAWVSAWATSEDCHYTPDISLATETQETNLDALIAEQDRLGETGRKRIVKRTTDTTAANHSAAKPSQTRRLKALPAEFNFTSDVVDGSELTRKGPQSQKISPLLNQPPSTQKRSASSAAPESGYRQYSPAELQSQAWAYVKATLERDDCPLADFQAYRGIGADGALDNSTFIEMKSFARGAPSEITFTEAEFRRADECKTDFYLVIVSGLEEGFDTEVRIYINPTKHLPWKPKGAVSVGGLAKGAALVLKEALD
ncbi:sacsin N-terminal ATP-binding-like domain-containing protein [Marinobacter sp.]|uniref:sacsin N-terminal ATP-binding-like domain-containing protein n=1 Tax=Marinobacter sp. TaxID=50741 RepID=UPI003A93F193